MGTHFSHLAKKEPPGGHRHLISHSFLVNPTKKTPGAPLCLSLQGASNPRIFSLQGVINPFTTRISGPFQTQRSLRARVSFSKITIIFIIVVIKDTTVGSRFNLTTIINDNSDTLNYLPIVRDMRPPKGAHIPNYRDDNLTYLFFSLCTFFSFKKRKYHGLHSNRTKGVTIERRDGVN